MNDVYHNLARKWRSKNFDQIVDQELPVRMLKNSLYLNHYFPVYLLSGQRGCGKTTTARVFAAAVNCEMLEKFQQNPQQVTVPCLTCSSCCAMVSAKHPDFIEIDAASHTGVDNIRQIIDSSSLLPLMGRKKIYLIDEAHMLSKAAFNALLKILEEPPPSVLFILATTDPQRIIETVRSRCFQLFFKSVATAPLLKHLKTICTQESIGCDDDTLELIINEADGSVRDALNLLEQVRFSTPHITKDAVLNILGHLDDERLLYLFELLLYKKPADLLVFLRDINLASFSANFIWNRLIELIRASLWIKYGVQPQYYAKHTETLKCLINKCSVKQLSDLLHLFYTHEDIWLKTAAKHLFLEVLFLQICQKNEGNNNTGAASLPQQPPVIEEEDVEVDEDIEEDEDEGDEEEDDEVEDNGGVWEAFLKQVNELNDPLIYSIFKQGNVIHFDTSSARLDVLFSKEFIFFKEVLEDAGQQWLPLLKKIFGDNVIFNPVFKEIQNSNKQEQESQSSESPVAKKGIMKMANSQKKPAVRTTPTARMYKSQRRLHVSKEALDVSDSVKWEKTTMILRYFPGVASEVRESIHE